MSEIKLKKYMMHRPTKLGKLTDEPYKSDIYTVEKPYPPIYFLKQMQPTYTHEETGMKLYEADFTGWNPIWIERQKSTAEFDEENDEIYYFYIAKKNTEIKFNEQDQINLTNAIDEMYTGIIQAFAFPNKARRTRQTGFITIRNLMHI